MENTNQKMVKTGDENPVNTTSIKMKDGEYYDAQCPRCGEVKAAKVGHNAICDTCNNHEGVVWFDKEELKRFVEMEDARAKKAGYESADAMIESGRRNN
ncbi:MAG: hypothetical protein ACTSWD_04770 [Candidatus Heimdallarchaeota archaeon]